MQPDTTSKQLFLGFHGRIIDHLGIQMYQSPVAAVAEMVSNAWDADAEKVEISLPDHLDDNASVTIADDGCGMSFIQCQERFLEVGFDRRNGHPRAFTATKKRPVLGRKGIGKFAGFGIAEVIEIETVSWETGERIVFSLDAEKIRGTEYVGSGRKRVDMLEYDEPDESRRAEHGTTVRLRRLTMGQRPSEAVFLTSMARRFLLQQQVDDFCVRVNGKPLPEDETFDKVEFSFPADYELSQRPTEIVVDDHGFGTETIGEGRQIKWRIVFYKEPIRDEELRGVAVFAHGKLAQSPFGFNLVGGLGSQQGLEYMSGRISADYVDELTSDLIAPERQRIDWQRPETIPLLNWGQQRTRDLLAIWQDRRSADKLAELSDKLSGFQSRLASLPSSERRTIESALKKIAGMRQLSMEEFRSLAQAILTAWEGGRLHELIVEMASVDDVSTDRFMELLIEAEVITSLHAAEIVRIKLDAVEGLRQRIEDRELENPLRDYIAERPWLISPKWETFRRETGLGNIIRAAGASAGLDKSPDWEGRVDLVLSSGDSALVLEFMRPGARVDADHVGRFERYVRAIHRALNSNTGSELRRVQAGYLVADSIDRSDVLDDIMQSRAQEHMYVKDWTTFVRDAESQWKEFIGVLVSRSPGDERLAALAAPKSTDPG